MYKMMNQKIKGSMVVGGTLLGAMGLAASTLIFYFTTNANIIDKIYEGDTQIRTEIKAEFRELRKEMSDNSDQTTEIMKGVEKLLKNNL